MRKLIFRALLYISFALIALSPVVAADMELEVIDLRHRPATELVPMMRPFVSQGGSITGKDYKLIIRSTPQNIDQIKDLLGQLDTALRELTVYVSNDVEAIRAEQEIAVHGRIATGSVEARVGRGGKQQDIIIGSGREVEGGASGGGRLSSTYSRNREPAFQTIRVQEGQWATIQTGQAFPVSEQTSNPDGTVTRTIRYHNVSSGFQVRPQLNGEQVVLFIRPGRASFNQSRRGQINTSGLETTVSTRLGQWVELGGIVQRQQSLERGITYSRNSDSEQRQQVFVKIELLP